jgi:site-specific DNA-methyltransferase (adenine-specific)
MILKEERIGGQRLILGDCLKVMPLLGRFDAVVTDPPYGVKYEGSKTKHGKNGFAYASFVDTPENIEAICVPAVRMAVGMARSAIITPGNANAFKYDEPRSIGVIYYPSGANSGPWGFVCSQPLFYYGKDPYLAKALGSRPNAFATTEATDRSIQHPCPKPLKTVEWMVARVSLPDEVILDPFMGSGTTLVACQRMGRMGTGIELDPDYFAIACKRVDEATRQPDMFVQTKPVPPTQENLL